MPKSFEVEQRIRKSVHLFLATLAFAAGCGDRSTVTALTVDEVDTNIRIGSVVVDPATVTVNAGDTGTFNVVVRDRYNRVVNAPVAWTSSNTAVVTINSFGGFARAIAAGTSTIRATSGGKVGVSQVTVLAAPVDTIVPPVDTIVPPVDTIVPPVDTVPTPDTTAASVEVTPGSASGAINDSAQFSATVRNDDGSVMTGKGVTWSSTNASVVVVSASGMGRAVGAGTAQLVATVDGVSGRSDITVTAPPPPPPTPAPVASISIAPTSVSMNTGVTTQLAATLRDANGNVLTGRSVTWSSSNGLVASVASGAVTGLVAGNSTITATSEGVSGNASAAVTLLPPPPPSGGSWANMPSTYSVVTDQAFNVQLLPLWELIWNNAGNGSIVNDATAPFSGSSVFQVKYPAGFAAGSAPATQYYPLGGRRNVFAGMWWKANANWQGHESYVNKLQFLFPNTGGDMYMTAYGPPGGPYALRVNLQFSGADTRSWLVSNVGNGTVSMGDWHKIEWLVEYNTSGANGIVRWWLDGQLVGNYTDVVFPGSGFAEYKLSPTWGGMGGINKQQTDYFWFDHVTISSR